MATDFDVIIIGSGAGGGTLARHLAPSGKSILLLERGDWLPREPENWSAEDVFVKNRYVSSDMWYDKHGKPFQPGRPLLRRRRDQDVRRRSVPTAPGRLRRAASITTASRRPGRSATTSWSRTTPRPSRCTTCTVRAAKTRPSRRPARPIRIRPCRTSRGSSSSHDDLARAGYHPFHSPCGIMLNERSMPFSPCVRCMDCDGFPCLVHAKSGRRGARSAAGAASIRMSRW